MGSVTGTAAETASNQRTVVPLSHGVALPPGRGCRQELHLLIPPPTHIPPLTIGSKSMHSSPGNENGSDGQAQFQA